MSEPTIVFVFELKHWYTNISAISKIDLLDIVPHVSVQFGFDYQTQAFLMVITKAKWESITVDVKKKFMMISRRIKEEMDGIMNTAQREAYENTDPFAAFAAKQAASSEAEQTIENEVLSTIPESEEIAEDLE